MPKSMKLKLKGGAYVDPESELENEVLYYEVTNTSRNSKQTLKIILLGSRVQEQGQSLQCCLGSCQHTGRQE